MNCSANANFHDSGHTGTPFRIENEPLLIERLQAFGLIESDGHGGWQLTECCQAGPAFEADSPMAPQPAVVRPWTPRKL